jgi:hypothetical protein
MQDGRDEEEVNPECSYKWNGLKQVAALVGEQQQAVRAAYGAARYERNQKPVQACWGECYGETGDCTRDTSAHQQAWAGLCLAQFTLGIARAGKGLPVYFYRLC